MNTSKIARFFALAFLLAGEDGTDGIDGKDGADGNVTCLNCHTTAKKEAITAQYEMSVHGLSPHAGSPTYIYAGAGESRKDCAICHTHEGFVEVMFTGRDSIAQALAAPTRIGCETCHSKHVSFDFTADGQDYALRATKPVNLIMDERSIDFGSSTNLCVNCHQPREGAPKADANGNFYISSSRYGAHHGPQSTLLDGIGGYEVGTGYPGRGTHAHRKNADCTTCHMHQYKDQHGGHTFKVSVAGCTACHSSATSLDVKGVQTEVAALMTELKGLLVAKGVITTTGSRKVGTFPINVAGAAYNYNLIEEDRSMGVHNPVYIKKILQNSIAAMK